MNKILVLLFLSFLFLSFVSAETFKQSQEIDFQKSCTNSSGYVCSAIATCNITIRNPVDNNVIVNNLAMTNKNNGLFNYTLDSSSTSSLGNYNWDMFCCDSNDCGEAHGSYQITKTGDVLTLDKAIIYLGMMSLLVFLFVITLFVIGKLPSGNTKSDDGYFIEINNLKYLRSVFVVIAYCILLAIVFISSNVSYLFLESTMVGDLLFKLFMGMGWMMIPMLFIWFIYIFISAIQDKEIKKILERGFEFDNGKSL